MAFRPRSVGFLKSQSGNEEPTDWGEIYTILLSHTNLTYEQIGKRTIRQLNAILDRLPKHLSIKMGLPFGGSGVDETEPDKPSTVNDVADFCAAFAGIT